MKSRKNKLNYILCCCLIGGMGCGRQNGQIQQQVTRDMTVQIGRTSAHDGLFSYRVKISPAPAVMATLTEAMKTALIYHMDSCFYVSAKGKVTYPVMVQYIAAGSGRTFEYLVGFAGDRPDEGADQFIYKDRFWNKGTFSFKP